MKQYLILFLLLLLSCVQSFGQNAAQPAGHALRFDQTKTHNVYVGQFWHTGVVYQDFHTDILLNAEVGFQYALSAGYGGRHNQLVGLDGCANGNCSIAGNVSGEQPGSPNTGLNSGNVTFRVGEWHLISVTKCGGFITTYIDGVPAVKYPKPGGRASFEGHETGGFIGGSDHLGAHGLIRYIRIFENAAPLGCSDNELGSVFRAELMPRTNYMGTAPNVSATANLLLDFSHPQNTIADKSDGLGGVRHNGVRAAGAPGNEWLGRMYSGFAEIELPQWELVAVQRPQTTLTPDTVPADALVFDSFNRNEVNYLWQNTLGIGQTEGGSLGQKQWMETHNYGIQTGKVYSANASAPLKPHVEVGQRNVKTCIENSGNEQKYLELYSAFDFVTVSGLKAYHDPSGSISFSKWNNGIPTGLGYIVLPDTIAPYTICIEQTANNRFKMYYDGSLVIDHLNEGRRFSGTKSGFGSASAFVKVDKFTVFPSVDAVSPAVSMKDSKP